MKIKSFLLDVISALVAYVVARWTFSKAGAFENLHWELLTFAAVILLLQVLVRGRRLAKKGKE